MIATAQHKTTGRIDQLREVTVQTILAGGQRHHGFDDVSEVADLHIRTVLYGAEERGDAAGVVVVADLCFGIRTKHFTRMRLEELQKLRGDHKRNRHLLCRFVGGVCNYTKNAMKRRAWLCSGFSCYLPYSAAANIRPTQAAIMLPAPRWSVSQRRRTSSAYKIQDATPGTVQLSTAALL